MAEHVQDGVIEQHHIGRAQDSGKEVADGPHGRGQVLEFAEGGELSGAKLVIAVEFDEVTGGVYFVEKLPDVQIPGREDVVAVVFVVAVYDAGTGFASQTAAAFV